ncbi:MAG: hypothetical protein VKL39_08885, partial [Leptolyngbyaceae bacterium]|nr:hypothetical protein [Leptolyngbyaceae bacterium]
YPEHPDHLDWDALSPADVRSLDLPLRNGNFQQGTLVLQWDALPFFYEYKLLLVAQSASTVSEPNELIQQDFEYRSPVPEAEVSCIEIDWTPPATSGSPSATDTLVSPPSSIRIRTRRVDIPLKRFWDALTTVVQEQWDSEKPDPKDSGLAERKLSSLPDRDAIYQIVELFSGNVEVQTEYLFDGAVEQFATRQLGERFIGHLEGVLPPTAHPTAPGSQADYVLETLLHQVSELQLKRSGYFTRISPNSDVYVIQLGDTEPKIIRRMAPSLFIIGVFDRGDRTNLLINSIPDLRTLSQFPGTTASLGTKEAFLEEWYATRQFSATPVLAPDLTTPITVEVEGANESVTLPDTVDYPEVPTPDTIPQALRGKLTIRHNAVIWNGTILSDEKTALNTYRQQRPDYQAPVQTAIRGVLDELQSVQVTTPFDVPERRPHPAAPPNIGTYSFALNFPSDGNNGNWVLRWTGPMSQAEEDTLTEHAQAYGTGYEDGVMALITAVQDAEHQRIETEELESQGIRPVAPSIPAIPNEISRKFSIDSDSELDSIFPTFVLRITYTLTWRGSMTDDEAELLQQTFEANSSSLQNAVSELIDNVLSNSRRNETFTEAISFAWPRLDQLTPAQREAALGNRLRGLAVEEASDRLRWTVADNLDESVDAIINRVQNRLNPGDPFIPAFETLIRQLDRPYTSPVRLQLLRVRAVLSEPEKQVLAEKFRNFGAIAPQTQTPVALLLDDIDDRTVINQLYASGFSQEPISRRIDFAELADSPESTDLPESLIESLNQVVDFPDPAETVLVWTGTVSPEERQAALELTGDDAFTAALDAMTRLRPDGASLPESIRTQLQFTVDPETNQEQLTWVFPAPTNDQIRVLQSLTADEGYESSLRRLIPALLN